MSYTLEGANECGIAFVVKTVSTIISSSNKNKEIINKFKESCNTMCAILIRVPSPPPDPMATKKILY